MKYNGREVVDSYCVNIILITMFVMLDFEIRKVSFIFWINGLSVVFLTLAIITIIVETFHPLLHISSRNGAYLLLFSYIFSYEN